MLGGEVGYVVDDVEIGARLSENCERLHPVFSDCLKGGLDEGTGFQSRRVDGAPRLFDEEPQRLEEILTRRCTRRTRRPRRRRRAQP